LRILLFIILTALNFIKSAVPPGFEDISSEEIAPIKIYYHNKLIGEFELTFDDDFLMFNYPVDFIKSLDFVNQKDFLLKKISGQPLLPNSEYALNDYNKKFTKAVKTKDIDFILNRNLYEAYLFVNPDFLAKAKVSKIEYYEVSQVTPMLYMGFSPSVNLDFSESTSLGFSTSGEILFSLGKLSFNANLSTSFDILEIPKILEEKSLYLISDKAFFNFKDKDCNIELGLTGITGGYLVPEIGILGFKFSNNTDYIVNPEVKFGSNILIKVQQPANIEVKKNGLVIYRTYYPPGNHYLDQTSFPDGVYNIEIVISYFDGTEKIIKQRFAKQSEFPAFGKLNFEFSLGLPFSSNNLFDTVEIQKSILCSLILEKRLSVKTSSKIQIALDLNYYVVSPTLYFFDNGINAAVSIAFGSDLGIGASLNVNYQCNENLNLMFACDYSYDDGNNNSILDGITSENLNTNFSLNTNIFNNSISINANYNFSDSLKVSGSLSRKLIRKRHLTCDLDLELSFSKENYSFNININSSFGDGAPTFNTINKKIKGSDLYTEYNSSYSTTLFSYNKINATARVNSEDELTFNAGFSNDKLDTSGGLSFNRNIFSNEQSQNLNITVNKQLSVFFSPKVGFKVTNRNLNDAGLFIKLNGATKEDKFEIDVSGEKVKMKGNSVSFVNIPSFSDLKVRINSFSDKIYSISNIPDKITLPSDSFAFIEPKCEEMVILMTILLGENGDIIDSANIYDKDNKEVTFTDETGFLELMGFANDEYTAVQKDKSCKFTVPNETPDMGMLFIDELICK